MTTQEIKDYRTFKTLDERKCFFETLQLKPLEDFIKEQFNVTVKFKKTICIRKDIEQVTMQLESKDLKSSAGILKFAFKKLVLATFGSISFHNVINEDCKVKYTELSFPDIVFSYEFTDGGYNGHDCIYVKYDLANRNWYFRNCKDNYKMTHAYDGTYRAYEENYENDRQIEIKEL